MPEPMTTSPSQAPGEPGLHRAEQEPKGVLQKNLKPMLYLGAAILVIVAAVFSGTGKKSSGQKANGHQAQQPTLQDTTDNNVQDLKSQVAAAEQKGHPARAGRAINHRSRARQCDPGPAGRGCRLRPHGAAHPVRPGQPCAQQARYAQQQVSPAQQEAEQLAARDRELTYDSRFASNLVYTRAPESSPKQSSSAALANSASVTGPQQNAISTSIRPGSGRQQHYRAARCQRSAGCLTHSVCAVPGTAQAGGEH